MQSVGAQLRQWARQHEGPFELPKLTDGQRVRMLERAVEDVFWLLDLPPNGGGQYDTDGELAHVQRSIDAQFAANCYCLQLTLLPVEVRDEIEARRLARRGA